MIQNTANKPISELFSGDNNISYYVPRYQREYIWNKTNWEALFDDIEESDGAHFLGSIICINTQLDSSQPAELELVDGQQRMTTITFFYLAIYDYLTKNIPDKSNLDQQLELLSLKKRITLHDSSKIRLSPSHTNGNFEDYQYIFSQLIAQIQVIKKPKYHGNRLISKAYNYFITRLNSKNESNVPYYTFDSVKFLLNKLNSATIVKIDVATHSDAFTLFETLNNRGVPLSAIDLIKNKLLGSLEKIQPNSIDYNFNRWNQIIKNLTEDYNIQERFLRQFYNAFKHQEEIAIKGIQKALRSNLIHIYETLIEKDVVSILQKLENSSLIYSYNIQYEDNSISKIIKYSLRNLENVAGADGYMLLLFIESKFDLKENDKIKLIDILCKYFIRRNVTDTPPTRDITNHFIEIIEQIETFENYNYEAVRDVIIKFGRPASDEVFMEKLNGDLYEENIGATRYILSSIELSKSLTREKYINFYERENNKFIWTVEHIFPQGENIPGPWVKMIANGNVELANEIRKSYVHKLGNLTLTGYNSKLSNLSLDQKQIKKSLDGKPIGFNNGLAINESIKDIKSWTKDDIINRTNNLVTLAMEIFKL